MRRDHGRDAPDFYTWTQTTARLVRRGQWQDLDQERLAEVIKDLGTKRLDNTTSWLMTLLAHLLQWRYTPSRRQRYFSIHEENTASAREEIWDMLEDNPRLRVRLEGRMTRTYRRARHLASGLAHVPRECFPEHCPWTLAEVLAGVSFPGPVPASAAATVREIGEAPWQSR